MISQEMAKLFEADEIEIVIESADGPRIIHTLTGKLREFRLPLQEGDRPRFVFCECRVEETIGPGRHART